MRSKEIAFDLLRASITSRQSIIARQPIVCITTEKNKNYLVVISDRREEVLVKHNTSQYNAMQNKRMSLTKAIIYQ